MITMKDVQLCFEFQPMELKDLKQTLCNPQFTQAGKIHDWRNYIPHLMQYRWNDFPLTARLVAYCFAEEQANRLDWY